MENFLYGVLCMIGLGAILYRMGKVNKERYKVLDTIKETFTPPQGKWGSWIRCVSCKTTLTDNQEMFSNGRCPHCGHKGANAGTIVDSENIPIRYDRASSAWLTVEEYNKLNNKDDAKSTQKKS